MCHIKIDRLKHRSDFDLLSAHKTIKDRQLEVIESVLHLFKDLIEQQFPADDGFQKVESPKLIEAIKDEKDNWKKRNLDDKKYKEYAELVNDIFQPLMNQVQDEKHHNEWDRLISEFFV